MSSHSSPTRLMFDQKKQKLKFEDMPVKEKMRAKEIKLTKSHSQDADRHAKINHQKSSKT